MTTTVQDGLAAITHYLSKDNNPDPPREARIILAHVLGVDVGRMTLLSRETLEDTDLEQALVLAGDRGGGRPLSHILGHRLFYGRRFGVTPDVLDPRPDTEALVAEALNLPFREVLDLGTGSGCILITLLAERPEAVGIGVDLSDRALEVAQGNAQAIGVADRVQFEVSDWFSAVGGTYDLIVSNPPYIAADEMPGLQAEVRDHEPRMALTDGADGLSAYRRITGGAGDHLAPAGWLMVEIGPTQGAAVAAMMTQGGFANVAIRPDLDGRDRVVMGQKPPHEG